MKRVLVRWVAACCVALLSACGGGSGSTGGEPFGGPGSGGSTGGTGGGTGGTGGSPTISAPTVTVQLSSQTVTASAPATVTARVADASGAALPGQVVNFTTANGRGKFSADSALTDANGHATVTLSPASVSTAGADNVLATVTIGAATATGQIGFQLTATNVTIASFTADLTTLGAYGQTGLTVTLAGSTPAAPVSVALSSACVNAGRATITPATVTTSTGTATFTYRDAGCGAFNNVDGIQSSITGTAATASLQLSLTSPTVSSISFVSAAPEAIFLRGSGFVENSNVTFQVRDANGAGVPNQTVLLEPTTLAGGLLIDGGSVAVTKQTDSEGKVLVRVNAGTVPTPVRIKATLQGAAGISTVSSSLAIAVGLPSQNNFSLSQGTRNIEGYDRDGTSNTYTIIASDRLGNPVPDDTAINFVTESGQVQAIQQTSSSNGLSRAVANFQSASPRPNDGRITVLAYALGEESFLDSNGNNVFDAGEDFQDLGDVFLDRLFNGSYNVAEDQFISLGIAGTDACNVAVSSLLRLTPASPSRAVTNGGASISTCVSGWGRAYVRKSIQTVLSTSTARPVFGASYPPGAYATGGTTCSSLPQTGSLLVPIPGGDFAAEPYAASDAMATQRYYPVGAFPVWNMGKSGILRFYVTDANGSALNPMAAGTVITVNATIGMAVGVAGGSPVPSTLSPTSAAINYAFDESASAGTITITFTSPSGVATAVAQPIYRYAPTDPIYGGAAGASVACF